MKRSAFLFAIAISLLGLSSCTKEATYSGGSGSNAYYSIPTYLVASVWEEIAPNVFISTLENAVTNTPGRVIGIYAVIDKNEVLISSGGTQYKNGYLGALIDGTDLKLTFRYFGSNGIMPFSQLDIKVVYQ